MAAVAALERRRVDLKGIRVRDETRVPKPSEVSNRLSWAPG
jgi:hypothetical protein